MIRQIGPKLDTAASNNRTSIIKHSLPTADTYTENCPTYGNMCDRKFSAIPPEIKIADYGHRHISAASWTRARDPRTGSVIWEGKNFRQRTAANWLRNYLERKNYSWLASAKHFVNVVQNKLKKPSEENQTNLG